MAVETELSIDDLAKEAAQSNYGLEHGKYRVQVTDFEWKYSQDEVAMGQTGLPKAGRAVLNYKVVVLDTHFHHSFRFEKFANFYKSFFRYQDARTHRQRSIFIENIVCF